MRQGLRSESRDEDRRRERGSIIVNQRLGHVHIVEVLEEADRRVFCIEDRRMDRISMSRQSSPAFFSWPLLLPVSHFIYAMIVALH